MTISFSNTWETTHTTIPRYFFLFPSVYFTKEGRLDYNLYTFCLSWLRWSLVINFTVTLDSVKEFNKRREEFKRK